jgi:hypothetical protein
MNQEFCSSHPGEAAFFNPLPGFLVELRVFGQQRVDALHLFLDLLAKKLKELLG